MNKRLLTLFFVSVIDILGFGILIPLVPYMGERGAGSDGSALGGDGTTPLRRLGSPQEVADVATFLASDESSFVTGDRIVCAGGRYM